MRIHALWDRPAGKLNRDGKKDSLTCFFEIFKWSLVAFQIGPVRMFTKVRKVFNSGSFGCKVLFSTIYSVVKPSVSSDIEASTNAREKFLRFFISKIDNIRLVPSLFIWYATRLLRSLAELSDFVKHMKPTSSPNNAVPSNIIKDVFDRIGPSIQVIIYSCLACSTVPSCFKHVVEPLLQKHNLDVKYLKKKNDCPCLSFLSCLRCLKKLLSQLLPF